MKIISTQKDIQKVVRSAAKVVQKNPQLAVLGTLLFEADASGVKVRATNLEIGAEYKLAAKVEQEGVVAIPATVLSSLIATLKGDINITLSVKEGVVEVTTKQGTTKIKTIPHEDFPSLPRVEDGISFSLSQKHISESFESVLFCASPSMIRPELASVYVRGDEYGLVSAATDSFRLAEKKVAISKGPAFDPILIPAKNIPDILTFIEGVEKVGVYLDEHHITFDTSRGFITSRLTSGNFPDYTQILPKDFTTHATVLSQDLIDALKKIAIFSDTFQKVSVHVDPKQKLFTLSAKNSDVGETVEDVAGALEGDEIAINFNHRYIHEVFSILTTDSTHLSFSGPNKPLLIEGIGDNSFLYIVMPMNR